ENALEDELAWPEARDPLDVLPGQARAPLRAWPFRPGSDILDAADMAGEVAEGPAPAARDAQRPCRFGRDFDDVADAHFRRHGQAVLDVAVALAEDLQIDSEDERAAFGGGGALDPPAHEAAILHDIELEPEWLCHRRRHVLDRADRHGGKAERDARFLRRPAGEDLAVAVLHAAKPDRRQGKRQRGRFAQDRGARAAPGDIDQDALAQPDALEIGAVGLESLLCIGAAVGIFEEL